MEYFYVSETGSVRQNNEDSFLLLPETGLFAVADGMGGHNAGEVASALAVETLEREAATLPGLTDAELTGWLETAVREANRRIRAESRHKGRNGMGTTLTAFIAGREQAVFAHVGDSRAYLFRQGDVTQLTRDHSVVEDLRQKGVLTAEEAARHPDRHVLSRALSGAPVAPDCFALELMAGDALLLCTDGFSRLLAAEEMNRDVCGGLDGALFAAWKDLVLERGAPDNFTAVLVFPRGRG
ncbi:MAG: protein phosphatase 2C domain-containing protein [Gracilibacteraceae bacterium]|jgi:protein phosphatase|nr:protein phosphatase 2C domain-containing protein [Gracilibacteraceae bacterium]